MLKCINCTLQRISVQRNVSRHLRTSSQFNMEKSSEETSDTLLGRQKQVTDIPDNFKRVFNFPYIRYFAIINRLKIYQTGITGILTSGGLILNQLDYVPTDLLQTILVSGIAGCIPLYTVGYLTGNFIGYIYYNEKTNMARIAYADHWGRRKDLELSVKDIIPLADQPVNRLNNLWFTFRRYSTKDTLRINTKYAIFVDEEALKKVI